MVKLTNNGPDVNTPASYLGRHDFDSWPGDVSILQYIYHIFYTDTSLKINLHIKL
jgi:hypothetical protein